MGLKGTFDITGSSSPRHNQNFQIVSGDTRTVTFTIYDNAGAVYNLTGSTVTFATSKNAAGASNFSTTAEFTTTATLSNPTNGICTVAITAANTADLAGQYHFELKVVDSSANIAHVSVGVMTVMANLT